MIAPPASPPILALLSTLCFSATFPAKLARPKLYKMRVNNYIWCTERNPMETQLYERILALLHREVKPALGCTEPIAVALTVARAIAVWPKLKVEKIQVKVSPNILKNAMGVGIPGTGLTGLPIATALSAVCGDFHYGLEVLKDVCEESVAKAKALVQSKKICIGLADSDKTLYASAECFFAGGHSSEVVLCDAHDRIVSVRKDGELIEWINDEQETEEVHEDGKFLTLSDIYDFSQTVSLDRLDLIREQIKMNTKLAEEGMKGCYGLSVGRAIADDPSFADDLSTLCMSMTASASDARMAGCTLPAMSNSGSGNQGITVSMPVIAAAQHYESSEEQLIRALTLSNLVAIHIKSYLGKLSALCGCVVASTGASCGILMLRGGNIAQMASAIKNMIGSITGMVCDGAKEGCAMKVASGVSCALQSAVLAYRGLCVQASDGIIDNDVEKTIKNLGDIGSRGMRQTDEMILDIMICK